MYSLAYTQPVVNSHTPRTRRIPPRLLDFWYRLPMKAMENEDDWRRLHHLDLPTMTTEELRREYRQVERRADYDEHPYLAQRLTVIMEELVTRGEGSEVRHDR